MTTDRDKFLAVLATQPVQPGDAIVVLCGEDGEARADVVLELLPRQAAREIVLTGGLNEPPRIVGAEKLRHRLVSKGVHPNAIHVDAAAKNTREQAVNVIAMAKEKGWKRLLLVASPYHAPRAFLTFLQALRESEGQNTVHLVNVPAVTMSWFESPPGVAATRADLLDNEHVKIGRYTLHCATYAQGLAYLKRWEGKAA